MNLSIRQYLTKNYSEIRQIQASPGQIRGVAFRIIQDMEVKSLMPFDICTLAEVLELPLGAVWQEIPVIAGLTESLMRELGQKKPLKRNEGTWLAFQIAYLHGLRQVLAQEQRLQRPWLDKAIIPSIPEPLQGLQNHLRPLKLTDTQAEQALSLVADSLLVQEINNAAVAWFVANGAEKAQAKLITQRLTNGLSGHLLAVIAENAAPLAQLQKFVRLGNSIPDLYREHYRASLLQSLSKPLFMEYFALKDIYIPPKGLPVEDFTSEKTAEPVDLITWANQQLQDLETIAVIESEPGYGKTSFCQMWAAVVARELYPSWTPVVISLRDVTHGKTFTEIFNIDTNLCAWLSDEPRCLLLLDGLDELPLFAQGKMALRIFFQQLLNFQAESCHKIFLTSRSTTLQKILKEYQLPLKRIVIQPWEQQEWRLWFQQWVKVQSLPVAQNFFTFVKQAGLFGTQSKSPELSTFVRQPLMLYLLAVLHRDGLLDEEIFQLAAKTELGAAVFWEIYSRLSRWLLGYPLGKMKTMLLRSGCAHIHHITEASANLLASRHPEDLLAQMQACALKILHSQRHQVNLAGEANTLPAFYFSSRNRGNVIEFQISNNISNNLVEFSHSKLGEYLCAEAIATQLKLLVQRQENAYGELTFVLDYSTLAQHLYNLLGYGVLSEEIEALLIEELRRQKSFSFQVLCDRLLPFWYAYCRGRWLDEGIAHKAWNVFQTLLNPVNVEQVNAAVGMNVFLLLCASHQEANVPFFPCGNPTNLAEFHGEALMMLIAKTAILGDCTFASRISSKSLACVHLSKANLQQVMLAKANLAQVNLAGANLVGANLAGANLTGANLAGANLADANLAGANLAGANLTGANLTSANLLRVNLQSVNFTNACLFDVIIADADRETAVLNGGMFSIEQFQMLKTLLSQSENNSSKLTANTNFWSNNTPLIGLIESVEGELISPADLSEDDVEDETVFDNY